jgi:hypothetical protein
VRHHELLSNLFLSLFLFLNPLFWSGNKEVYSPKGFELLPAEEKELSDSWMGVYMNGVKVGYSHSQEFSVKKDGKSLMKDFDESSMKVSRLGGKPVEIFSAQESLSDEMGRPLECTLRMKMSETETITRAEVEADKIIFKSNGKVIKELPYQEQFYLEPPLKKIIKEDGLTAGRKYSFKILEPVTYSLVDCSFEIIGKEDVLILGKKMKLWHVREEMTSVVPVIMDEWMDPSGDAWKTASKISFVSTTSIRMPKEKAVEISGENFDIAFSTIIKPNLAFERPQEVQGVTFKLSGVSPDKIKDFPFDDGSQKIVEVGKDYVIIQTNSQIFSEKEAVSIPVEKEELRIYLKPTSFCESDDTGIQEAAKEIIGEEKNSWRAAKKISEWVKKEMTPNYDVGFATAKETLKNRKGDCSEYTVLAVALCRASGIPSRAAVGIMSAQGIFAYHMWPEVYVGRWIGLDSKWLAMDKKSGEYYTDATHIKFGRSLLDENIFKEMAQAVSEIVGQLKLEILDYHQNR